MADSQLDIAPITADPYVSKAKDKLQTLREGLKIDLGPSPPIPTVTDVRAKLGDVDKPVTSYEDYIKKQGLIRGQEENLSQIESGQKQRVGA